jgi:integrase/recombinase XerD
MLMKQYGRFCFKRISEVNSHYSTPSPEAEKGVAHVLVLYDARGRRKYLVPRERWAFLNAALDVGGEVATFCAVLAFCGARISEVLALTPERIDDGNGAINFETLKRRERGVIRAVPVPRRLLDHLNDIHHFRETQADPIRSCERLWPWSRTTAWRRVKEVMRLAHEPEFVSQPKALRHAFGAEAVLNKVTLPLVKKWMGHAKLETTEIYTSLIGEEERALARLNWRHAAKGYRF